MMRSTLKYTLQICPFCGYIAFDISEKHEAITEELVKSERYQQQRLDPVFPMMADVFLCHAQLEELSSSYSSAGWSCLKAAWVCDDEIDSFRLEKIEADKVGEVTITATLSAKKCRIEAVRLFLKARESGQVLAKQKSGEQVLLADVLRRSERFEEAKLECESGFRLKPDKVISDILRLEQMAIENRDPSCYNMSQVEALISIPDEVDRLVRNLSSTDQQVQLSAISDLAKMKQTAKNAVEALVKLFRVDIGEIGNKAMWAVGEIGNQANFNSYLDVYFAAFADKELYANYKSAKTKIQESGKPIEFDQYLKNKGLWTKFPKKSALDVVGISAVEALISALDSKNTREIAIEALGKIGDHRALSKLIKITHIGGSNISPAGGDSLERKATKAISRISNQWMKGETEIEIYDADVLLGLVQDTAVEVRSWAIYHLHKYVYLGFFTQLSDRQCKIIKEALAKEPSFYCRQTLNQILGLLDA
jgi:hypothetical protein